MARVLDALRQTKRWRLPRLRWLLAAAAGVGVALLIAGVASGASGPHPPSTIPTSPPTSTTPPPLHIGPNNPPGLTPTPLPQPGSSGGGGIGGAVMHYLTTVPNFAFADEHSGLQTLKDVTTAIAFGLLAVMGTIAVARYWLSGLSTSGDGGIGAVNGLTKMVLAALLILLWSWLFSSGVQLANAATNVFTSDKTVADRAANLMNTLLDWDITSFLLAQASSGLTSTILGWIGAVLGVLIALFFLALLMLKVAVSSTAAVLFVAMPIAIVLWIDEFSAWLSRIAFRAMFVCLVVPFIWALLFAIFATADHGVFGAAVAAAPTGTGSGNPFVDALLQPIFSLALVIAADTVPVGLLMGVLSAGGVDRPLRGALRTAAMGVGFRMAQARMMNRAPQWTWRVNPDGSIASPPGLSRSASDDPAGRGLAQQARSAWEQQRANQPAGNRRNRGGGNQPPAAAPAQAPVPAGNQAGNPPANAAPQAPGPGGRPAGPPQPPELWPQPEPQHQAAFDQALAQIKTDEKDPNAVAPSVDSVKQAYLQLPAAEQARVDHGRQRFTNDNLRPFANHMYAYHTARGHRMTAANYSVLAKADHGTRRAGLSAAGRPAAPAVNPNPVPRTPPPPRTPPAPNSP
jgi:hypothetical protein